jgi:hypothetical protein
VGVNEITPDTFLKNCEITVKIRYSIPISSGIRVNKPRKWNNGKGTVHLYKHSLYYISVLRVAWTLFRCERFNRFAMKNNTQTWAQLQAESYWRHEMRWQWGRLQLQHQTGLGYIALCNSFKSIQLEIIGNNRQRDRTFKHSGSVSWPTDCFIPSHGKGRHEPVIIQLYSNII